MKTHALDQHHHHSHDSESKVVFGFWVFILSDFILFAAIFATYAVLHGNTYGSLGIKQIMHLPSVLVQTIFLLTSALTYGLGVVALNAGNKRAVLLWLGVTFLLGALFIKLELRQFAHLLHSGYSWQTSAFFSSYFTLLGMQAAHLAFGLLWMLIVMVQLAQQDITATMKTRIACLGLFWDFLNILWICIFTLVYLMGAI